MTEPTNTGDGAGTTLAGVYTDPTGNGRTLRRDAVTALKINDTRRREPLGPGDAARYVTTLTGHVSTYAGNLYGPGGLGDAGSTADYDGCEFQNRADGVRYVITSTGEPGEYVLTPKAATRRGS